MVEGSGEQLGARLMDQNNMIDRCAAILLREINPGHDNIDVSADEWATARAAVVAIIDRGLREPTDAMLAAMRAHDGHEFAKRQTAEGLVEDVPLGADASAHWTAGINAALGIS